MIKRNKNKYVFKKDRTISSMNTAFKQDDKEIFEKNIEVLAKK